MRLSDPPRYPPSQVHAFVENGDDQGGRAHARQAEDDVVLTADHPQAGLQVARIPGHGVTRRQSLNAASQLTGVTAGLSLAPLSACISNNLPQIGFGRRGEDIRPGQATASEPSSCATISSKVLSET